LQGSHPRAGKDGRMGKIRRIQLLKTVSTTLRIASYALTTIGLAILLFNLILNMENLLNLGEQPIELAVRNLAGLLYTMLFAPLMLIIVGSIIHLGYKIGEEKAAERYNDLVKEVLGTVMMYKNISLRDLAVRIGEHTREVETFLAKLRYDKICNVYVDSQGIVHLESVERPLAQPVPQPIPVQPVRPIISTSSKPEPEVSREEKTEVVLPLTPAAPSATTPTTPTSPTATPVMPSLSEEEKIKKKEEITRKMIRLKEAYEKGLISEETYRKMLEELEREASQV